MADHGSAARHTFYYLLILVSLGFTAVGVGQILFQIVNSLFTETIYSYSTSFDESILRFGITSVIIASPIFFMCSRAINRELSDGRLDLHSLVRKWLTYLILFVVSVTIIGDLMTTLYSYLSGEITIKFILKALIIIGISGFIFSYYLYDISREKFTKSDKKIQVHKILFIIFVAASLVAGFFFNITPGQVRAEKEDYERVDRLRTIHNVISNQMMEKNKLPSSLEEIKDQLYLGDITDPVSKEVFQYEIIDQDSYSICANFTFSNREKSEYESGYWRDPEWLHDEGKQCFEKTVKRPQGELKEVPLPPSV